MPTKEGLTTEELASAIRGCHTRIGLKRLLHEHCGLSGTEAAAKVKEWFEETKSAPVEVGPYDAVGVRTRAARKVRAVQRREQELRKRVHELAEEWLREEISKEVHERWEAGPCDTTVAREEILEAKSAALLAEVRAAATDDALLALLCRRGIHDVFAAGFVWLYGPEAKEHYEFRVKEIAYRNYNLDYGDRKNKPRPFTQADVEKVDWDGSPL